MHTSGIPLRLNTGQLASQASADMDTQDKRPRQRFRGLGTLTYTRQFEQRLEQARRAETAEDHLPYSQWAKSPYVVRRLRARLGSDIIRAIMAKRAAIEALYADAKAAASDDWREWRKAYDGAVASAVQPFGVRVRDVERAERQIGRLCREELMSYRPRRAKQA